jgi:hypothetical protein
MLLYGIGILLLFIAALQYLGMARKKENPNEKLVNRAFGIVIACTTIQFSLLVLYFLSLEGYYGNHSYVTNLETENLSLLSRWLFRSSWIPFYTFNAVFIYAVEKIRNKKNPLGSIICIIGILIQIFVPWDMALVVGAFPVIILLFYYSHTFFNLMKWAKKELKAATSFVILGYILIFNSVICSTPPFMITGAMPSIIRPLSLIIGSILCVAPTFLNPKFFLRSMNYWYAFCAGIIGYWVFMLVFLMIFSPLYTGFALIMLIFFGLECALFLKFLLREEGVSMRKGIEFTGVFTRPKTITEEEVSVSKEKKICLVCKNEVLRVNYICPECKAFYCKNCYEALSNLENVCWVCDTPFDESKPFMPFEEEGEEEDLVFENGTPKKAKKDKKMPKKKKKKVIIPIRH